MTQEENNLSEPALQLRMAFRRIHMKHFANEPIANPNLEVEVIDGGVVETTHGPQQAVVLVTPWMINGVLIPGDGLPEQMLITNNVRPVFNMEADECGKYAQVALVPDVMAYTTQNQAHTIGKSFVPVFVDAVKKTIGKAE